MERSVRHRACDTRQLDWMAQDPQYQFLSFGALFCFSERDEGEESTEVNHLTPANGMHVSEEVSSDLQKESYL